jgi:hypothetical protein
MMVEEWHTFHTKNLEQDAVLLLFDMVYESLGVFKKQYWMGVIAMQVHGSVKAQGHDSCISCNCGSDIQLPVTLANTWVGPPHLQNPFDFLSISDIIFTVKPDIIIETGKGKGNVDIHWHLSSYAGIQYQLSCLNCHSLTTALMATQHTMLHRHRQWGFCVDVGQHTPPPWPAQLQGSHSRPVRTHLGSIRDQLVRVKCC